MANRLLLQTGDFLLLETGDKLLLQNETLPVSVDAGSYAITGAPVLTDISKVYTAGSYSVTGYPVTFALSLLLPVNPNRLLILPDESRFI